MSKPTGNDLADRMYALADQMLRQSCPEAEIEAALKKEMAPFSAGQCAVALQEFGRLKQSLRR